MSRPSTSNEGDQPLDRCLRAGAVGVAQAEVVDVVPFGAQPRLELVDRRQHVGRQCGETGELIEPLGGPGHGESGRDTT